MQLGMANEEMLRREEREPDLDIAIAAQVRRTIVLHNSGCRITPYRETPIKVNNAMLG